MLHHFMVLLTTKMKNWTKIVTNSYGMVRIDLKLYMCMFFRPRKPIMTNDGSFYGVIDD